MLALPAIYKEPTPPISRPAHRKLYDKRGDVLAGKVDVAKGNDGTLSETEPSAAAAEEGEKIGTVGVPEFWVRALMNHGGVQETIAEEDLPALEYLQDVRCVDKEDYTVCAVRLGWPGLN